MFTYNYEVLHEIQKITSEILISHVIENLIKISKLGIWHKRKLMEF